LQHGADVAATNQDGESVVEFAKELGEVDLLNALNGMEIDS